MHAMDRREIPGFVFTIVLSMFVGVAGAQSKPLFVNCGSNATSLVDGRSWDADEASGNNITLSSPGLVASLTSKISGEATYGPLYRTARIFNASSNYTFLNVSTGNYYIRLHFYPQSYDILAANQSVFDVTANSLKLISKYNLSEEIVRKNSLLRSNSKVTSLLKEYFLNISSNMLWIEFTPASGSFAFVNAIELVPVLDNLFFDSAGKVGSVGVRSSLNLVDRGLETMYRLNVGGPEIESNQDKDLWRTWETDNIYMSLANAATVTTNSSNISYSNSNDSLVAPLLVYEDARATLNNDTVDKRFNMSWHFSVDPNFEYLVRLHFCELEYNIAGQRVFRIYINFRVAAENYDVVARAQGKNKAYNEDYIDSVSETDLLLQLGPDSSTALPGTYALLNGLEIFKLSRNGNLAHALDNLGTGGGSADRKDAKNKTVLLAIGATVIGIFMFAVMCFVFFRCCYNKEKTAPINKAVPPGWRPLVLHDTMGSTIDARVAKSPSSATGFTATNRLGRRFTLAEIRKATENFDESLVIGTGGFGKVYKGDIEEESITVAIKRANPQSQQGLAEFETEIEMLSKLRHRHLVSMIGYCDEQKEMILVYEYMANGTLRSHLFGCDLPPLSWKQRLDACIGAARGLHYLHTGAERGIIHRDVKTTNILLDENFVAKMSDFGLSKTGPALDHTHVSTAVKGSFGYLDPEYFRRQQLTQKSDVYSFGVVLFEVVCARPVINPTLPKDQINLAEWAIRWQRQGSLETIVDPRLEGDYSVESLKKFGEIAGKCLADDGKNRPTMGDVLWHLEYAMQLHEAYTRSEDRGPSSTLKNDQGFSDLPPSLPFIKEAEEYA